MITIVRPTGEDASLGPSMGRDSREKVKMREKENADAEERKENFLHSSTRLSPVEKYDRANLVGRRSIDRER